MTKIKDILAQFEEVAPFRTQESYDNSGLLVGNPNDEVKGILCSLDCTEEIIDEAIQKGCNLIVSHHPIIFKGLKRLTGANYVERTVIKAIQKNIALIAVHTNLDNYRFGVNHVIANRLGLENQRILAPLENHLQSLKVFVPSSHANEVRSALAVAGAGAIGNYASCSYSVEGEGRFMAKDGAKPFVGEQNALHTENEISVECVVEKVRSSSVIRAMLQAHPYEEVAYFLSDLQNKNHYAGAGMIGELSETLELSDFLNLVKERFNTGVIRFTNQGKTKVKRIALCGGSGSFLTHSAKLAGADVYLTADMKYHEFFDAESKINIVDIGHFESEQHIVDWFVVFLSEKFTNFAVHSTNVSTNPINYL